jgi:lipoate-protein ligase A
MRRKNGDTKEKFFDVDGSYEVIIQGLMNGLSNIGLNVEQGLIHCPVMLVDDLKISGNAQARRKGFILQHGTILLHVDAELMYTILKAPEGATKSKMVRSVRAKVTGLYDKEGVKPKSDADFQKIMVESFERKLNIKCEQGTLTDYEKKLVEDYKIKRYTNGDWLRKFP